MNLNNLSKVTLSFLAEVN